MIRTTGFLLMLFAYLLVACQKKEEPAALENVDTNLHRVVVAEVVQSSQYTYLRVGENDREYWVAIAKRPVEVGETYYYDNALEMTNFTSKELNRTFDRIYFVQDFRSDADAAGMSATSPHAAVAGGRQTDISITPVEGGVTVAELFSNRDTHAGKVRRIRGKVIKVNAGIMGRNWVHIQDGTAAAGDYDLTVTTNDEVTVGSVVTFEGRITLNKDFGAGYVYAVIMEDARVLPASR